MDRVTDLVKEIDSLSKADFIRFQKCLRILLNLELSPCHTLKPSGRDCGTDDEVVPTPALYNVVLLGDRVNHDNKIRIIKIIRQSLSGFNLKEAYDLVTGAACDGQDRVLAYRMSIYVAQAVVDNLRRDGCPCGIVRSEL